MNLPDETVIIGVGILGACITALWLELKGRHKKIEDKLEVCEENHEKSNASLLTMSKELGEMKGQIGELKGVEYMAGLVIKEVKKIKDD